MFGSRGRLAWTSAFLALLAADVTALMEPLSTPALVDGAACIVEGRVAGLSSRWTDDGSAIVTEVALDVTDVLLGETNRVTFLYDGGEVGALGQRVSDMPSLKKGQQVFVFLHALTPRESGRERRAAHQVCRYSLVGAAQGVYRIEGTRAVKDGFSVVGDASEVERNIDVKALKDKVRQRLVEMRRSGRAP